MSPNVTLQTLPMNRYRHDGGLAPGMRPRRACLIEPHAGEGQGWCSRNGLESAPPGLWLVVSGIFQERQGGLGVKHCNARFK